MKGIRLLLGGAESAEEGERFKGMCRLWSRYAAMSWGRAKKAPLKYLARSGPCSVYFSGATMATPALVSGGSGGAAAGSGGGSRVAGRTRKGPRPAGRRGRARRPESERERAPSPCREGIPVASRSRGGGGRSEAQRQRAEQAESGCSLAAGLRPRARVHCCWAVILSGLAIGLPGRFMCFSLSTAIGPSPGL